MQVHIMLSLTVLHFLSSLADPGQDCSHPIWPLKP